MTTTSARAALVWLMVMSAACGSSPTAVSAPTSVANFHAEVTDPVGDAVASIGVSNPPDLVRGTVDVNAGSMTVTIQFAPGTQDRQSTRLTIELDTDQNPATGITGASGLGIDYVLDLWPTRTPPTLVQQATPVTCATAAAGACYTQVGTASLSVGADTMTATVPLAMFANASGRFNYRVFAYASPQTTVPTVTADVLPDVTLPPAHVP
jgi:hypothetical protein